MYHHVRGTLVAVTPSTAVVEAGGLGFQGEIPFPVVKELEPRFPGLWTWGREGAFRNLRIYTGREPARQTP